MNRYLNRMAAIAGLAAMPLLAGAVMVWPASAHADPRISVNLGIPLGVPGAVYVQPYPYLTPRVVYRPAMPVVAYGPVRPQWVYGPYRPMPRPWRHSWNNGYGGGYGHRH